MRAYKFGLVKKSAPKLDGRLLEIFRLQNQMWNDLVALSKDFDGRFQAVQEQGHGVRDMALRVEGLEQALTDAQATAAKERSKAKGGAASKEIRGLMAEIRASLKAARTDLKTAKAAWRAENKEAMAEVKSDFWAKVVEIEKSYKDRGLFWTMSEDVKNRFETARDRMIKERTRGQGNDLRFHRFDGSGSVHLRFQRDLCAQESIHNGANTLVTIGRLPDIAGLTRGDRKRACRVPVSFFVGRNGERKDGERLGFEIVMHRPLPEGCLVKGARLIREKTGPDFQWFLSLSVAEAWEVDPIADDPRPFAALDVGWRSDSGVLRVAALVDSEGRAELLALPWSFVKAKERCDGLRSAIDEQLNCVKEELKDWLRGRSLTGAMAEAVEHLAQWRSPAKFCRLYWTWSKNRVEGDDYIFARLGAWRTKHMHLWRYQTRVLAKITGRRREQFRIWVKDLASRYSAVYVEDFPLPPVRLLPAPGEGTRPNDIEHRVRELGGLAAVGEFRSELTRACKAAGTRIEKLPAAHTTTRCPACGLVAPKPERIESIPIQCPGCKAVVDQDFAAAVNMIALVNGEWSNAKKTAV